MHDGVVGLLLDADSSEPFAIAAVGRRLERQLGQLAVGLGVGDPPVDPILLVDRPEAAFGAQRLGAPSLAACPAT
jgi:hypothetical protein